MKTKKCRVNISDAMDLIVDYRSEPTEERYLMARFGENMKRIPVLFDKKELKVIAHVYEKYTDINFYSIGFTYRDLERGREYMDPDDLYVAEDLADRLYIHWFYKLAPEFNTLVTSLGGFKRFKDLSVKVRNLTNERAIGLFVYLETKRDRSSDSDEVPDWYPRPGYSIDYGEWSGKPLE